MKSKDLDIIALNQEEQITLLRDINMVLLRISKDIRDMKKQLGDQMLKEVTEIFVLIGLFITNIIYKLLGIEEKEEDEEQEMKTWQYHLPRTVNDNHLD